jgi:predicted phage terminase large subunit-like protein
MEGKSGLLANIPKEVVAKYNKQDHEITLVNGSSIRGISGDSYERLRGPQFHWCWADELAAFQYLGEGEAWDMMMMGLRLGDQPRVIVTTTPRPKDLILDLVGREGEDVIIDRASTYENEANLASTFRNQLEQYKGSKLYEQEVLGKIVDLEDGKVVSRDMFKLYPADKPFPKFEYIVQSYDSAYTDKTYNDPTASTTWGVFKPTDGPTSVLLLDCWAEHLTFPKLKPKVLDEWRVSYGDGKDAKRPDLILVEAKASGLSLVQELQAMHLPVRAWNPGGADKMTRLQITASIFATGRVWLPESSVHKGYVKDWAEGFLSQICAFPDAAHDDYVDSATQAIRLLKDMGFLDINPDLRYDDDDDYAYARKERVNPYAV